MTTFSRALEAMKIGMKMRQASWPDPTTHVYIHKNESFGNRPCFYVDVPDPADGAPDRRAVKFWRPSEANLLGDDWEGYGLA